VSSDKFSDPAGVSHGSSRGTLRDEAEVLVEGVIRVHLDFSSGQVTLNQRNQARKDSVLQWGDGTNASSPKMWTMDEHSIYFQSPETGFFFPIFLINKKVLCVSVPQSLFAKDE
jgi:hypothetical protein